MTNKKHTLDIVEREKRKQRFWAEFRSGNFINERTGLQNPFEIEGWWNIEINKAYQQGFKDGEKKGREKCIQYIRSGKAAGSFSEGCECEKCDKYEKIVRKALKD